VNYTGAGDSTHVSRFTLSSVNPDSVAASSEFKILTIYQSYINHNGGDLNFGPDGYLYIGMGDGGNAGDPGNRAQDSLHFLGKMLRIDVDNGSPYTIPVTNPFKNHPHVLGEIWALGLRNPWRFSFDPLTGDVWIADVGQNLYEEIDFQPVQSTGGENYGWRCYEGNSIYNISGCKSSSNYTFPVFVYPHDTTQPCNSVTGGFIYRGSKFVNLYGSYFFADYCTDDIRTLHDSSGTWVVKQEGRYSGNNFSTFGTDAKGEIYIAGHTSGTIYKIADSVTLIEEIHQPSVRLYPNPFTDHLTIKFPQKLPQDATLDIIDLQGRQVYALRSFRQNAGLDLGFLARGIYFLHVEINQDQLYKKIIKE
jgi:glucose/arabinose dehydrogenase